MFYEIAVTHTNSRLKALDGFVKEIQRQAKQKGMSDQQVMDMKLAEDMFAFGRQIQIATDIAKGCVSRLTGKDNLEFTDNQTSLDELLTRIETTINFVHSFTPKDFIASDDTKIEMDYFPNMHLTATGYVMGFHLPNLHFHTTTAYNICRKHGFEIGKKEFLWDIPLITNS